MATFAIGDVQGCYQELRALLRLIAFKPKQDTLWFVGDLVNRGPQSLEVLRFVKRLGPKTQVVLGNHDLHLISAYYVPSKKDKGVLKDVLLAHDAPDLIKWLSSQPLIHHDGALGYTMVHAGIPPCWTLSEALKEGQRAHKMLTGPNRQGFLEHLYGDRPTLWKPGLSDLEKLRFTVNALTRMRYCDPSLKLKLKAMNPVDWEKKSRKLIPWFLHPKAPTRKSNIIFGHWAALSGTTYTPHILAIDTGCVWGGFLTAMRLEDKARFSVPRITSRG